MPWLPAGFRQWLFCCPQDVMGSYCFLLGHAAVGFNVFSYAMKQMGEREEVIR